MSRRAPRPVIDLQDALSTSDADAVDFVHGAHSESSLLYVEPDAVLERAQTDLFSANIRHALTIAESLWVTDQILTPVLIDKKRRLVDGKHRVIAVRLLREPKGCRAELLDRFKADGVKNIDAAAINRAKLLEHRADLKVPVLRLDFDSNKRGNAARIAEIVSNAIHDRRSREFRKVLAVVQADERFSMKPGRPASGTVSGRKFLARVFGVDARTISEWTAQEQGRTYRKPPSPAQAARRAVQLAARAEQPAQALLALMQTAGAELQGLGAVDEANLATCLELLSRLANADH